MSKGSKVVPVRIEAELLAMIDLLILRANEHTQEEPYTRSSWIKKALAEKINHLARSKKKRCRIEQEDAPKHNEGDAECLQSTSSISSTDDTTHSTI